MKCLLLVATLFLLAIPSDVICQSGCGIMPIKPIIPIGCKDLKASCQCDQSGKNCKWVWICVK